jgi:hypothetical protein
LKLKQLKSIANLPFATPAGDLVTNAGYDVKTCIFGEFASDEVTAIPAAPRKEDLIKALQAMWEPWAGYRFASGTDRAAMLSAIFTAVCRPALNIAPAYFFDAPVQASGKTKCAAALAALTRGKRGGISPYVEGAGVEAETVKKLVAMLLGGEAFWLIDNVVGTWKSPVIASLITEGTLSERILGGNSWYRGEARLMVCATGNNASLDRDLGRRFIRVRIDAGVETPQARNFAFDPVDKALSMRMEIASAVLMVIQGFWVAQPASSGRGDAGFSEWNRVVRQCILWLASSGIAGAAGLGALGDPAHSIIEEAGADDPETSAHQMFLTGVFDVFPGVTFQSKDVLRLWETGEHCDVDDAAGMVREGLGALLRQPSHVKPTTISIGKVLKNRRDRLVNGMCFRQVGIDRNGVTTWMVGSAGSAGGAGD